MPGWLQRLFGGGKPAPDLRSHVRAGPIQQAYWTPNPAELAQLREADLHSLSWRELLRLHHLLCLPQAAWGSEASAAGDERGPVELEVDHRELIANLCSPASPYRPRSGFVWLGDGPPPGGAEQTPYSNFQGRMANRALTHLGTLEVIELKPGEVGDDLAFVPDRVEFIPFDELMTLAASREQLAAMRPAFSPTLDLDRFRPAQVLSEYGRDPRVVLVALDYVDAADPEPDPGPDPDPGTGFGPALRVELPDPYRPDAMLFGRGRQELSSRSEFANEGLSHFALAEAYQLSLAIDPKDPRFSDKCRGRGLDPAQTRASVAAEHAMRYTPSKAAPKIRLKTL